MKIAFITGARSDYGPFRTTLKSISLDENFNLDILVHGIHFLDSYGNSINEIKRDSFGKIIKLETLISHQEKSLEMMHTFKVLNSFLKSSSYNIVVIVGDRLECYAAALAAHFAKVPILHSGGGHITNGAIDNIYRYNITNLSKYHLTTSKKAYNTLRNLPNVNIDNVHFTGSPTVDAIKSYLMSPIHIEKYVPNLSKKKYVLITFHPVTLVNEPVVEIMKAVVEYLSSKNIHMLITYPNNDEKSIEITSYISSIKKCKNIHVVPHLGSNAYFSAIYCSEFVIGNSSSGPMEVPYFKKHVLNIGTRQEGRALDKSVTNVDADIVEVIKALSLLLNKDVFLLKNEELYGDGTAVEKTIKILKKISVKELQNND
jgi:UDP-hydrolysing UDP-N-acetyl-D-glucosamine 2-epimerase